MPIVEDTIAETGEIKFSIPNANWSFTQPPLSPRAANSIPVLFFRSAAEQLAEFKDGAGEIANDMLLSEKGKEAKVAPLAQKLVDAVVRAASTIELERRHVEKREAELLRVPSLDPTHSAMAVEDREMRDWWRSQPAKVRIEMLEQMDGSTHQRLMIALMRSPVPVALDHELRMVRDIWATQKRLDNIPEALAIDDGREWAEWAQRGLGHLVGGAQLIAGINATRMLNHAIENDMLDAPKALGFDPVEIERARQAIKSAAAAKGAQ